MLAQCVARVAAGLGGRRYTVVFRWVARVARCWHSPLAHCKGVSNLTHTHTHTHGCHCAANPLPCRQTACRSQADVDKAVRKMQRDGTNDKAEDLNDVNYDEFSGPLRRLTIVFEGALVLLWCCFGGAVVVAPTPDLPQPACIRSVANTSQVSSGPHAVRITRSKAVLINQASAVFVRMCAHARVCTVCVRVRACACACACTAVSCVQATVARCLPAANTTKKTTKPMASTTPSPTARTKSGNRIAKGASWKKSKSTAKKGRRFSSSSPTSSASSEVRYLCPQMISPFASTLSGVWGGFISQGAFVHTGAIPYWERCPS